MRVFGALVKNELIKIYSKKSVYVITAILLLITAVYSVFDINDFDYSYDDIDDMREMYIHGYTEEDVEHGYIEPEMYGFYTELDRRYNEAFDYFAEVGLKGGDDWRMGYVSTYLSRLYDDCLCDMYFEGKISAAYVESFTRDFWYDNSYKYDEKYDEDIYYDEDISGEESELLDFDGQLRAYQKSIKDEMELSLNYIKSEYAVVYSTYLESVKSNSELYESMLDSLLSDRELTDSQRQKLESLKADFEALSDRTEEVIEYSIEQRFDHGTIEQKTVAAIQRAYSDYSSAVYYIDSREEFEETLEIHHEYGNDYYYQLDNKKYVLIENYDDALDAYAEDIAFHAEPLMIGIYALENGVAEMTVADSARSNMLSAPGLFFMFAFLAVFVAGGIVSKEYSKKTINLLLVRPVSRVKILTSKYVAMLVSGLGTTVVSVLVYTLVGGIRYGFGDLFEPYLFVSDGEVCECMFGLFFTGRITAAMLGVVLLATIAFMLSTVTKNTGAAIALTYIIYSVSSFASSLMFVSEKAARLSQYLPFGYFGMWDVVFSDVHMLGEQSVLGVMVELFGGYYDLLYGSVMLVVISGLAYLLSAVVFNKRDIK